MMTFTIDLTTEEEALLVSAAAGAGLGPEQYLRSIINKLSPGRVGVSPTGSEIVEQLTRDGVIGAGFGNPKMDSPEAAREIRHKVWRTGITGQSK